MTDENEHRTDKDAAGSSRNGEGDGARTLGFVLLGFVVLLVLMVGAAALTR